MSSLEYHGAIENAPSIRGDALVLAERLGTMCQCGEILSPRGQCLNVGGCSRADRAATRQSLHRGTAASARPSAWTLGGRVD